jgi:hypothetical protein
MKYAVEMGSIAMIYISWFKRDADGMVIAEAYFHFSKSVKQAKTSDKK